MKALIFKEAHAPLEYLDVDTPTPATGEVLVKIKAGALNHRDVWITKGLYPGLRPDVTPGSCGAGTVDGRDVIINPNVDWGTDTLKRNASYTILGMPTNGTFAEYIAINPDRLVDKPAHLSMEEAAALPLAGVTAYRALFSKARCQAGDKVLINGVGGGVALFACQFAIAAGADVYVTSSKQEKIDQAIALGAKGGALYTEPKWSKSFAKQFGTVDIVIDSAGGDGFNELLKLCSPHARIATYGGTRGTAKVEPSLLFWKEIEIYGTTMGSDTEFEAMVDFVNEHKLHPVVDSVYALADHAEAYAHMDAGKQFGKIVLKM